MTIGSTSTIGVCPVAFVEHETDAGLVLGRFTIAPSVSIPISFDDAETSYGIGVTVSLGGPPQ